MANTQKPAIFDFDYAGSDVEVLLERFKTSLSGLSDDEARERLEAQREDMEDYELVRMLEAKRPAATKAAIGKVIRAFDDYTKEARVVGAARRKVLEGIG